MNTDSGNRPLRDKYLLMDFSHRKKKKRKTMEALVHCGIGKRPI
jgi:hypothetical protein